MAIRAAIIVLSDQASRGQREDRSGPRLKELAAAAGWEVIKLSLLPDEPAQLRKELAELADRLRADLIMTSGGTGLGPRDITPEVTAEMIEKTVPGIAELLRKKGFEHTATAVLSRGVAGVRGATLIINLPGSPRSIEESWEVLKAVVPHAVELLQGKVEECGRE